MFDNLRTAINELTAEVHANNTNSQSNAINAKILGTKIDALTSDLSKVETLMGEISKLTEAVTTLTDVMKEKVQEAPAPVQTAPVTPVNWDKMAKDIKASEVSREEKTAVTRKPWPKHETDRLIELRVKNTPLQDIYKAFPDRTPRAIDNKLSKLKIKGLIVKSAVNEPTVDVKVTEAEPKPVKVNVAPSKRKSNRKTYRRWTETETTTVVDLIKSGYTCRNIAILLDRTENSIYNKARLMGLINKRTKNTQNA